jgi:hypothetical protein
MRKLIRVLIAFVLFASAPPVIADDVTVDTVLTDLNEPSSVAIRPGGAPERYEVFVADSGARRAIKISSNAPNRSTDVIAGFPAASAPGNRRPMGNPFGLLFVDEKHLVVGVAGAPPELRLYELTDAGAPLTANAAKQRVTPEPLGEESKVVYGEPIGLARTRSNDFVPDMLMAAIRGSGVAKVPVRANVLGEMSRLESMPSFRPTAFFLSSPTALAISEQGYLLAVDDGSRSIRNRFMFLNPTNGQVVLGFDPGLTDVSGAAYSPKSGNLYALGTAYGEDEEGLFRLDDARKPGEQQISVTKVADIEQATALAFGPDGALYVTTLGDKTKDDDGALLKVTGDL